MELAAVPFGFDEFDVFMAEIGLRAEQASLAFDAIGDDVFQRNAEAFGGTPDLVDTGDLRASLTDRRAPGAVWKVQDSQAMFGTEIPYARFHQTRLLDPLVNGPGPERWLSIVGGWVEDGETGIRMVGL